MTGHSIAEILEATPDDLAALLTARLANAPTDAGSPFAPELSYGRHRGPRPHKPRVSAIAVTMYPGQGGEWTIPLTLRPTTLSHHAGQICLPGGRLERGESFQQAAFREYEEELGVAARPRHICGELPGIHVYASNNWVHPVVALLNQPPTAWNPDPVEVDEVIELPLKTLFDINSHETITHRRRVNDRSGKPVGWLSFKSRSYAVGEHQVWGATAMMLNHLAQILLPRQHHSQAGCHF